MVIVEVYISTYELRLRAESQQFKSRLQPKTVNLEDPYNFKRSWNSGEKILFVLFVLLTMKRSKVKAIFTRMGAYD